MAHKLWTPGIYGWQSNIEHVLNSVAGEHPPGERLVIYYSYPSGVNSVFSTERAAQLFSRWDLIVFGQPLQEPDHEEHDNAVAVIEKIHEYHPGAKVFGYVSLAVANGASAALTDQEIQDRIDAWQVMGCDGMLLDEYGFDYQVPRTRQNMALDYVHEQDVLDGLPGQKMVALVNAWVQADAFAPDKASALAVDPNIVTANHDAYNPDGIPSTATTGDYTLLETWVAHTEFYPGNHIASIFNIKNRADHARHYRTELGVKPLGGSVVNYGTTTGAEQLAYFQLTEAFARMFGLDGWAVDALDYSANVANLAVVKSWPYNRGPLPRAPEYWMDDTAPDDWLTFIRHDLGLKITGTSTTAGESTWTIGTADELLGG